MEYHEYLRNKSCIVVAPSGYLKNRRKGSFIDGFDRVVKCNDFYDMNAGQDEELGARCDIWYGLPENKSYNFNFAKLHSKLNPRIMCIQPKKDSYAKTWQESIERFKKQNELYGYTHRIVDEESYELLVREVDSMPMTGLMAINDLLHFGAKSVYALGFDFHTSGYYNEKTSISEGVKSGWHKVDPQMKHIWDLLQNDSRFDCDDNLKQILHSHFDESYSHDHWQRQITESELEHFCNEFKDDVILIFRSCNFDSFSIMAEIFNTFFQKDKLSYVVQKSVEDEAIFDGLTTIRTGSDSSIKYEEVIQNATLQSKKFVACLVPYNNLPLKHYFNIIKIVKSLNIKEVYFVSQRGPFRKLFDIQNLCEKLEFYLKNEESLKIMMSKFDIERFI